MNQYQKAIFNLADELFQLSTSEKPPQPFDTYPLWFLYATLFAMPDGRVSYDTIVLDASALTRGAS